MKIIIEHSKGKNQGDGVYMYCTDTSLINYLQIKYGNQTEGVTLAKSSLLLNTFILSHALRDTVIEDAKLLGLDVIEVEHTDAWRDFEKLCKLHLGKDYETNH